LIENYRQSSADGISITFLLVWMAGDITNLAGALWADLVPTVIALAIYFCFADAVLLSQCFYYNTLNARRERKRSIAAAENAVTDENAPLLAEQENLGLPGSRRRSSAASRRRTRSSAERSNSLTNILEEGQGSTAWLKNTLSVAIILIAGAAGWAIAWRAGAWKPTPVDVSDGGRHMPVGAEVLGYASAVCYLGYDSHHRHATQACTDMLQVPASLRSSRTTARDHAKDCLYCSFCFRSWAILPTAPEYVLLYFFCFLPSLTVPDPSPLRREAVLPQEPSLAHWIPRNYLRRRRHLHAVPHVWREDISYRVTNSARI